MQEVLFVADGVFQLLAILFVLSPFLIFFFNVTIVDKNKGKSLFIGIDVNILNVDEFCSKNSISL